MPCHHHRKIHHPVLSFSLNLPGTTRRRKTSHFSPSIHSSQFKNSNKRHHRHYYHHHHPWCVSLYHTQQLGALLYTNFMQETHHHQKCWSVCAPATMYVPPANNFVPFCLNCRVMHDWWHSSSFFSLSLCTHTTHRILELLELKP